MFFNPSSLLSALQLNGIVNYAQSFTGSPAISQDVLGIPEANGNAALQRDAFLDNLVANMTIPELGEFLHQPRFSLTAVEKNRIKHWTSNMATLSSY
jgi:hypothetical protein